MKRSLAWHDIRACLDQNVAPEVVMHRGEDHVWRVCQTPLYAGQAPEWALVASGEMVRIPLVPYTSCAGLESLAGAMLELGTGLGADLRNAVELLLVIGMPVQAVTLDDGRDGSCVWVGIAYRIK